MMNETEGRELIDRSKKSVELLEEIRDLLKRMNARELRDSKRRKQGQDNIGAQAGEYMGKIYDEMKKAADTFADRTQPIRQQDWRAPARPPAHATHCDYETKENEPEV